MIRHSIRWRLILAGTAAIVAALSLSAVGLALLFERHVERVAVAELDARAMALVAMVEPHGSGTTLRAAPVDPFYDQPFSGHYWQIALGPDINRSRSLWDFTLKLGAPLPQPGERQVLTLDGPTGQPLLAVDRSLLVGGGASPVPLRITVATSRDELDNARRAFIGDLLPYVGVLGALLLAASWVQISVGLRPLAQIGARVAELSSGFRPRIGRDLPAEVIPLATEIDTLLDARDRELARARHRAADLAHGLKTPLQALLGDAKQLRDRDEAEIADSIETIAGAMHSLVHRELTRARIQSDRNMASADPTKILERIVDVLRRTPAGRDIDWRIDAPDGLLVQIDPDDLTEALGALLENAVRHARRRIELSARPRGRHVELSIRDDGPGAPEAQLTRIMQRGVRLDQSAEGHGIGLAIVADIVDAANGELELRNVGPGLLVTLKLNAASER